jgi:hypothetical protein
MDYRNSSEPRSQEANSINAFQYQQMLQQRQYGEQNMDINSIISLCRCRCVQSKKPFFKRPPEGQSGGTVEQLQFSNKWAGNGTKDWSENSLDITSTSSSKPNPINIQAETLEPEDPNLKLLTDTQPKTLVSGSQNISKVADDVFVTPEESGVNSKDEPKVTKSPKSHKKQKSANQGDAQSSAPESKPSPLEISQIVMEPVLSRKTKKKVFKPEKITKMALKAYSAASKNEPNPAPPLEMPENTVSKDIAFENSDIAFKELVEKIDNIKVLATNLNELVQMLEKGANNPEEFVNRFEMFSKYISPPQFIVTALNPLILTAEKLCEALLRHQTAESNIPNLAESWSQQYNRLSDIVLSLKNSRDLIENLGGSSDPPPEQSAGHSNEADSGGFITDSESASCSEEVCADVTPVQYLDKLIETIQDLLLQAQPRHGNKQSINHLRRKFKNQKLAGPSDPFYVLAAATGIEPLQLMLMTREQKINFIKRIQENFPNPVSLIATILESDTQIDFEAMLPPDCRSSALPNRIKDLEDMVRRCKEEEIQCERELNAIKKKNDSWRTEVEKLCGVVYENSDDDEWIDEDE